MAKRIKWTVRVKKADAIPYQPEIHPIIKKEVISKGVKPLKERYRVINGQPVTVSPEVKEVKPVIKETIIREGMAYQEPKEAVYEDIEIDCLVSELQDYGTYRCYKSPIGKIDVPNDAIEYEEEDESD